MKTKTQTTSKKTVQLAAGAKASVSRKYNRLIANATNSRTAAAYKAHKTMAHARINAEYGIS